MYHSKIVLLLHVPFQHAPKCSRCMCMEKQMIWLLCPRNPSIIMSVDKFVDACLLKRNILVAERLTFTHCLSPQFPLPQEPYPYYYCSQQEEVG